MFTTYLVTALRMLRKSRLYSVINVLGLSLGLAATILIMLYVQHEFTADRHHEHYDEIYRVGLELGIGGPPLKAAVSSYPAGPALKDYFPEITDFVRIGSLDLIMRDVLLEYDDKAIYKKGTLLVDSNFFDLFTHPVVYGDPEAALRHSNVAVLTRSAAERIFGPGDPVGKQFRFDQAHNIEVGAVIEDIPDNSHLKFRMLLFWNSLDNITSQGMMSSEDFFSNNLTTYLRGSPDLNTPQMQERLNAFVDERILGGAQAQVDDITYRLHLHPMQTLYFLTDEMYEPFNPERIPARGNRLFVYVFITVAIFIAVIASINYMNMAVARSGRRSREVGVRKVLGADRSCLIRQFLTESLLTVVLALLVALLWVELLIPVVNQLLLKELSFSLLTDWSISVMVLLLTLVTGLFAGSYPAFYLSHFRPSDVLKSRVALSDANLIIRKLLVGLQFTISVFMVIATIIVMQQLSYMRSKDLGYSTENMMVLNVSDLPEGRRVSLQNELDQLAAVEKTSLSNNIPGPGSALSNWGFNVETRDGFTERMLHVYRVDQHFQDVYGIEVARGRFYDPDQPTDMQDAVVVNEAAVQFFEWEDPIGKRIINMGGDSRRVIGVVQSFHIASLEQEIVPLVILPEESGNFLHLKLLPGPAQPGVSAVKAVWEEIAGLLPMRYEFLDERHRAEYLTHQNLGQLFGLFALLCIFLSLMGLFGLSGFSAEQKTKEIGIRVVHGASLRNILGLLYKDYGKLMLLAIIIASGTALYFLENWLAQFAYRVDMGVFPFVSAALLALAVSLATVGYHAWRTVRDNPVEALKHE